MKTSKRDSRLWCGVVCVVMASLTACSSVSMTSDSGMMKNDAGSLCRAGLTRCGSECIDVDHNDSHCGECNLACTSGTVCAAGTCVAQNCSHATCASSQVCENEKCVGFDCVGSNCTNGQTCFEGKCWPQSCGTSSCAAGFICRFGECTDINCVGVVCKNSGDRCARGVCSNTCVPDLACTTNPSAPCKTGKTVCTSGVQSCVDNANAPPGTSCGTDQVCDANGTCIACVAQTSCTTNPSNPCRTGVQSCVAGMVVCQDAAPADGGVGCGANQFCDGTGSCTSCIDGAPCSSNPGAPCITGATVCSNGQAQCVDQEPVDAGTSCGATSVCASDGGCQGCEVGISCTTNPNPCMVGETSCTTGSSICVDTTVSKAPGESCGATKVCAPDGGCVACTAGASCGTNPSDCLFGVVECGSGVPVCVNGQQGVDAGSACGTNQKCDGLGSCVAANCSDGLKNGTETDVDCGGATCGDCAFGKHCTASSDCNRGICESTVCRRPISCKELHTAHASLGTGIYSLDPDKGGALPTFNAHCDMTTSGGGWTALLGPSKVGSTNVDKWPGLTAVSSLSSTSCPSSTHNGSIKNENSRWVASGTTTCVATPYLLSVSWQNVIGATQALYAGTIQSTTLHQMSIDGTLVNPNVSSGSAPFQCHFFNGNNASVTPVIGECWKTIPSNATGKIGTISGDAVFSLSGQGGFPIAAGGSIYNLYVR